LTGATLLYLDTQFAFAYLVREDVDHEAACALAARLADHHRRGRAEAVVSILTLTELSWALAGALYDRRHGTGAWRNTDRQHSFVGLRREVAAITRDFLNENWVRPVDASAADCYGIPDHLISYRLSPADLAHLLIATSAGAQAIISNDRHFRRLENAPLEIISYGLR
jgi:predicted nucleic acid-binding protein